MTRLPLHQLAWLCVCLAAGCAGTAPLPPAALEQNQKGIAALATGDLENAEASFALALEYHPQFLEALVNLALVELRRGNFARAELLVKEALETNEHTAQPHYALGLLRELQGRRDEARGAYVASLAVHPGFLPARLNLARLLFEGGHFHEAERQYRRAVSASPETAGGWLGHAEALLKLNRAAEAESSLAHALQLVPSDPHVRILAARLALRRGELETSRRWLAPLLEEPNLFRATALAWLATTEHLAGNDERARQYLAWADADDPEAPLTREVRLALEPPGAAPLAPPSRPRPAALALPGSAR